MNTCQEGRKRGTHEQRDDRDGRQQFDKGKAN